MVTALPRRITGGWRLGQEMGEYLAIFVYLYICVAALLFYKAAILHGHGIGFAPYGLAAGKALLLSKFMLIGSKLGIGAQGGSNVPIRAILYKTIVFFLLLAGLSFTEDVLIGLIRHRGLAGILARFGDRNIQEIAATSVLLLLILIPYFAYHELDAALGKGQLRALLRRPA